METNTAEKLLEALTVELANMPTYKSQIGFDEVEIKESNNDLENLSTALDNVDISTADSKGVTMVKNLVYKGEPNATVEPYPAFAITALPFPSVKAGSLSRYTNRKQRAKLAPGYTEQVGVAMGYEDAASSPLSPDDLSAAAKIKDVGGYQFEAEFKKQGLSGMAFQHRLKGTEKWGMATNAIKSPVRVTVEAPDAEGAVVQIEIRCRLLQGNDQVGQSSPIYPLNVSS